MRLYVLAVMGFAAVALATTRRCHADEEFSLVINPFTGAASLRNDGAASVAIDSYFVTSAGTPVLNPVGWTSLQDSGAPGWRESFSAAGNRLGELNLFDSLTIAAGGSVGLGHPYAPFAPTAIGQPEPGLSTLNFSYTLSNDNESRFGDVEFSARNTVVLVVDPTTGAASLQNQSAFNINIDGYLIKSPANVIDVAAWTPLAEGSSAWQASTGAANRIGEGNLFGSTLLAAHGGSLALGNPIDPALLNDETDLALDFTLAGGGTIAGGVLFASGGASADFDDDGDVDGLDLSIWRGGYGGPGDRGDGDANGDSAVDGGDFLIWQRQRGGVGAGATSGAAAVPEPAAALLAAAAAVAGVRPRARRSATEFRNPRVA